MEIETFVRLFGFVLVIAILVFGARWLTKGPYKPPAGLPDLGWGESQRLGELLGLAVVSGDPKYNPLLFRARDDTRLSPPPSANITWEGTYLGTSVRVHFESEGLGGENGPALVSMRMSAEAASRVAVPTFELVRSKQAFGIDLRQHRELPRQHFSDRTFDSELELYSTDASLADRLGEHLWPLTGIEYAHVRSEGTRVLFEAPELVAVASLGRLDRVLHALGAVVALAEGRPVPSFEPRLPALTQPTDQGSVAPATGYRDAMSPHAPPVAAPPANAAFFDPSTGNATRADLGGFATSFPRAAGLLAVVVGVGMAIAAVMSIADTNRFVVRNVALAPPLIVCGIYAMLTAARDPTTKLFPRWWFRGFIVCLVLGILASGFALAWLHPLMPS